MQRTGRLDAMCDALSEHYDQEIPHEVKRLTANPTAAPSRLKRGGGLLLVELMAILGTPPLYVPGERAASCWLGTTPALVSDPRTRHDVSRPALSRTIASPRRGISRTRSSTSRERASR